MCVFVKVKDSVTVNSEFWTFRPALVILSQILGVRVAPHLNSTNSLRISVNKIVQAFRSSCRAPSLFEQKLASEFPVAGTEKLWEYISLCKKVLCWQDCHRSAKTKAQEVVRTVFSCSIIRVREKHCWPSEVAELVIRSSCVVSFSCFSFVTPGRFRLLFPFQLLALAIVSWFCLFRAEEIKNILKNPVVDWNLVTQRRQKESFNRKIWKTLSVAEIGSTQRQKQLLAAHFPNGRRLPSTEKRQEFRKSEVVVASRAWLRIQKKLQNPVTG